MTAFRIIYSLIGVVISISLIYYIFQKYNVIDGLFSRGDLKIQDILVFMTLYAIAIFVKPLRYIFIMPSRKLLAYSRGFYIGNFLNLFIPFRIGDISRIFMFTNVISKADNLRFILIEKVLDLSLMLAFLALIFLFSEKFFLVLAYYKYALFIIIIIIFLTIYFNLLRLSSVLLISAIAWFIEGLASAYFLKIVLNINFMEGFSFMPITTISTLIPSAPGYLGVINLAMISWAEFLDVANLNIGSIAFEVYILTWICTFLFGFFSIILVRKEVMNFLVNFFKRTIK